jgi:hypothetical protein
MKVFESRALLLLEGSIFAALINLLLILLNFYCSGGSKTEKDYLNSIPLMIDLGLMLFCLCFGSGLVVLGFVTFVEYLFRDKVK